MNTASQLREKATGMALLAICAVLALSLLSATPAYAKSSGSASSEVPTSVSLHLGRDAVWAGAALTLKDQAFENDFLGAGQTISISSSTALGSVRAAGQQVTLKDVAVAEGVTIAGETLRLEGGTAHDVAMASRTASFKGTTDGLHVWAEQVYIDGTVTGDADVTANSVELGPNAVIEGTLHVVAGSQPTVASTARVNAMTVSIQDDKSAQVTGALSALGGMMFVTRIILGIVGALLIAVAAEWLFKKHTAGAAAMIRERTGATIGTGIIAALVAPLAIVILLVFVITIPIAGAVTLVLLGMSLVAVGFMGASVFKLAFPRLGRFKTALAGGAIMGVASVVPILGGLVGAAAFMYLLGYVLQCIFLTLRNEQAPVLE